jgi:integrase
MLYKQPGSKYYWTKFQWRGQTIRKRTGACDKKGARAIEATIRSQLAQGNFGILQAKQSPTLGEFLKKDFGPFVEGNFKDTPKTAEYYEYGIKSLLGSELSQLRLNEITNQHANQLATRLGKRLSPSTTNCVLRTPRRALNLAEEWGKLERAPKITLDKGERQRDRVLTDKETLRYLMACAQPWRDVATIMFWQGVRPGELYPLRWEDVLFDGEGGLIKIVKGKSKKARRTLPMVPEVYKILAYRHAGLGYPVEGWVFPTDSKSGHLEQGSAKNQHAKAVRKSPVNPFPPYVFRHTALTNLSAEVDPFTLQTIAGHSSITTTQRYCHPQADAVARGFEKLVQRKKVVIAGSHSDQSGENKTQVAVSANLGVAKI